MKMDRLVRVHELAQEAAASRARVVEAMAGAHGVGATHVEIAAASGLSVPAVAAYLAQYHLDSVSGALRRQRRVGRPPDPHRAPREFPEGKAR